MILLKFIDNLLKILLIFWTIDVKNNKLIKNFSNIIKNDS